MVSVFGSISCAHPDQGGDDSSPALERDSKSVTDFIASAIDRERQGLIKLRCDLEDRACLGREIVERYRLDQWIRTQITTKEVCGHYREQAPKGCRSALIKEMVFNGDIPNTARLKEIVERHGWPDTPGWGQQVENAAWYLVQHAQIWNEEGTRSQWDLLLLSRSYQK